MAHLVIRRVSQRSRCRRILGKRCALESVIIELFGGTSEREEMDVGVWPSASSCQTLESN